MKSEQEIKNQMIQELVQEYKDVDLSEIKSAVDSVYGTCGCCYCWRYDYCSNLKSINSNKSVLVTDSCSEFLHFYALD